MIPSIVCEMHIVSGHMYQMLILTMMYSRWSPKRYPDIRLSQTSEPDLVNLILIDEVPPCGDNQTAPEGNREEAEELSSGNLDVENQ